MSYVQLHTHMVFRTLHSQDLLTKQPMCALTGYVRGVCKNLGIHLYAIGGIPDHIHLLLDIPPALSISEATQKLKSNSSRLMNKNQVTRIRFQWQAGYGAFSVSPTHIDAVRGYIAHQEEHHKNQSPKEEFRKLLERYGLGHTAIDVFFNDRD